MSARTIRNCVRAPVRAWCVCAAALLIAASISLVASTPAAAAAATGCNFGPESSGDTVGLAALDLVSNGWVDVETDGAGRLWVKASIVTATLSATPGANLPVGAPGASWELRMENTAQRPSNGFSDVFFRAQVDASGAARFDAGWVIASAGGGGSHVYVPYVPVNGTFEAGSPGLITISAPADSLGFFASGDGYGDVITDVFSDTSLGAVDEQATAAPVDRAPNAGYATGRYRVTAGNHSCIDVSTWVPQTTPIPADSFVDSVGVNVRLQYWPSNYNGLDQTATRGMNYPKVEQALTDAGIRYIRDFLDHGTPDNPEYRRLYDELGIRTDLTYQYGVTQAQVLAAARALGPALVSLEGVNEPDCVGCTAAPDPNFPTSTQAEQRAIYAAVKADPALASIVMLPPALATPAGYARLGDLSDAVDAGNIHTYAYTEPYQRAGILDQYIGLTRKVSGPKPIEETETGYMTTKVPGAPGTTLNYHVVSERAHGAYIPKTLLTNLASGVRRTYITELVDQEPIIPGDLGSFGIVRSDFSPKPAHTAVKNLNTLLADPGPAFTPTPFSYNVSGDELRHLVLQKRDGSTWLAVWKDARLYSSQSLGRNGLLYGDLHPGPTPGTVTFGSPVTATTYHPLESTTAVSTESGVSTMSVSVPAEGILLYELTTGPGFDPVVPELPFGPAVPVAAVSLVGAAAIVRRRRHTAPRSTY